MTVELAQIEDSKALVTRALTVIVADCHAVAIFAGDHQLRGIDRKALPRRLQVRFLPHPRPKEIAVFLGLTRTLERTCLIGMKKMRCHSTHVGVTRNTLDIDPYFGIRKNVDGSLTAVRKIEMQSATGDDRLTARKYLERNIDRSESEILPY